MIKLEQVAIAFEMLAKSTGIDSYALLGSLREATGGTVSDIDLMRIGYKLVGTGLASTLEEIVALVNVPELLVVQKIVPPNWEYLALMETE